MTGRRASSTASTAVSRSTWATRSSSSAAATPPSTRPASPAGWAPRRRSSTGAPAPRCRPSSPRSRRPSRRACRSTFWPRPWRSTRTATARPWACAASAWSWASPTPPAVAARCPSTGSEFEIDATFIIPAISQEPDFDGLDQLREGRDWIKVDQDHQVLRVGDKVYAGGDATNLALVTIAIGSRPAGGRSHPPQPARPRQGTAGGAAAGHSQPAQQEPLAGAEAAAGERGAHRVEEALELLDRETTRTFTLDEVRTEAIRCMSCGQCFDCENCFKYCQDNAVVRPEEQGGEVQVQAGGLHRLRQVRRSLPVRLHRDEGHERQVIHGIVGDDEAVAADPSRGLKHETGGRSGCLSSSMAV